MCNKSIIVDDNQKKVYVKGNALSLTALEYRIIQFLFRESNRVISREELFETCWMDRYMNDDDAINVHMSHLRKKISEIDRSQSYIRTVRGMGYQFVAAVE